MTLSPPPKQSFSERIMEVLRDPSGLPPEFAAWVRGQIVRNPTVKLDPFQLPTVERKHIVGVAGEPAFQNSWTNFGGAHEIVSFWKDLSGVVHLQGLANGGASGTAIFTLPPAYRPSLEIVFCVLASTVGRLDIMPNGDVLTNGANSAGWLSLSGLTFRP